MYKKQMSLQKVLCYLVMIVSAAVFVYSLGIMTDLYDTLYSTMNVRSDLTGLPDQIVYTIRDTEVEGSAVYYYMQEFNRNFLIVSIALLLLAVLLFITNTHIRRRYYIGNYVASGLYAVSALAVTVWAHGQIEAYKAEFLKVDFAALKEYSELFNSTYTESTFWFDLHYFIFAILVLAAVLLVANAVWKMNLMKREAALLQKSAN